MTSLRHLSTSMSFVPIANVLTVVAQDPSSKSHDKNGHNYCTSYDPYDHFVNSLYRHKMIFILSIMFDVEIRRDAGAIRLEDFRLPLVIHQK